MKSLEEDLRDTLNCQVIFDEISRSVYSVDASIFEIPPAGIVIPKSPSDLLQAVAIAAHHRTPITARGAATGITGGCLGHGLILDLSKYFQEILKVDIENKFAVCQPGVIQDDLNSALAPFHYRLGPDTSTGNRATLGGMVANNSAGARSLRYGKMGDHIQQVRMLLSTGEILSFGPVTEEQWRLKRQQSDREGEIYRTLWDIKQNHAEEITKCFPPIPRRVSGYNLDELLKPMPFNPAKIIAGSEGTLGIITEITLGIVPCPNTLGLLLLFFDNLHDALDHVPTILEHHPISLEMLDSTIIEVGRTSPSLCGKLEWIPGHPQALLIVEFDGSSIDEVKEKIGQLSMQAQNQRIGYAQNTMLDPVKMAHVWELRKSGLGLLLSKRSYSRAIAFLEDLSIPPEHLAPFMKVFCAYLASHGKTAGIYGHVGAGCMHIRPYIDLRHPGELILMRQMMVDTAALVLEYKGALSGEHGDGWIRSWLNPTLFGETLMQDFERLKFAFDPLNLMNPGKIIPTTDQWERLRANPGVDIQSPPTFLNFEPEGGLALAADLCNGNGLCRKKERTMCPSFQATQEEFHSTRARAQALRAIMHQRLPLEEFTGQGLYDVMDLCLSCKGCKTECPSQVDMAKMKSEFLYHYQEKHGYSFRNKLFGKIGQWTAWMGVFPKLFNALNQSSLAKRYLNWIGISTRRELPRLATKRFSTWFSGFVQSERLDKQVVLLNDTFMEFNHPEVGQAAVKVLNALGYRVIVPAWSCCGRPALSKGLLPEAKQQAEQLVDRLLPYVEEGLKIVGLEPSCLLTLRDDYAALLSFHGERLKELQQLIAHSYTLDEFLAQCIDQRLLSEVFGTEGQKVKVHGHCYQKALVGMEPTLRILRAIPGMTVEEISSGCCGMAGSFGYEKEHEEVSMKIGELKLFPTVRACEQDEWVIASGTSCRHQIKDGTKQTAMHLAEALAKLLREVV